MQQQQQQQMKKKKTRRRERGGEEEDLSVKPSFGRRTADGQHVHLPRRRRRRRRRRRTQNLLLQCRRSVAANPGFQFSSADDDGDAVAGFQGLHDEPGD